MCVLLSRSVKLHGVDEVRLSEERQFVARRARECVPVTSRDLRFVRVCNLLIIVNTIKHIFR